MKICIIGGGGAIGGFLAVQLARAGNDVTVVARGVTYEAIKKKFSDRCRVFEPIGVDSVADQIAARA